MAAVSLGETWGGEGLQVNLAEKAAPLPGTVSCNTTGALETKEYAQPDGSLGEAQCSLGCA